MELSGTEDLGAVAKLLYGHIVSNTTILSPVETSYVLIAALIPQDVSMISDIPHKPVITCAGQSAAEGSSQGGVESRRDWGRGTGCSRSCDPDM